MNFFVKEAGEKGGGDSGRMGEGCLSSSSLESSSREASHVEGESGGVEGMMDELEERRRSGVTKCWFMTGRKSSF